MVVVDSHYKILEVTLLESVVRLIPVVEMIEMNCTAAEENIAVGTERQEDRRMAVGKLPQVVCTVLEKMIHTRHLEYHHMRLAEGRKVIHSKSH